MNTLRFRPAHVRVAASRSTWCRRVLHHPPRPPPSAAMGSRVTSLSTQTARTPTCSTCSASTKSPRPSTSPEKLHKPLRTSIPISYGRLSPAAGGWLPMAGQVGRHRAISPDKASARAICSCSTAGSVETRHVEHGLRYARGSDDVHALWGYLEVGQVWNVAETPEPPAWATGHPHFRYRDKKPFTNPNNTVYVATERLSFDPRLPGGGTARVIPAAAPPYATRTTRSHWDLPISFQPAAWVRA